MAIVITRSHQAKILVLGNFGYTFCAHLCVTTLVSAVGMYPPSLVEDFSHAQWAVFHCVRIFY